MIKATDSNIHEAAFCGDFCGKCPNYLHECRGCIPEDHQDCHFVRCCQRRKLEHCGFCEDLPCEKLGSFVPDGRPGCPPGYHIMNLRARVTMGTETWLVQQRGMWGDQPGHRTR